MRLEVFGTGDSIVVGQDTRSPIRSVEPDARPRRGSAYRDFWDRFEPAYRNELAAFIETVRTGAASPCSLEEARALNRRASELGVTVNTLLQGAWGVLLGQLTGRQDVVFGTTVSGRDASPDRVIPPL